VNDALPLPIAALLRRARNAKSAKERHDAALCGFEASVRLAVARDPPAAPEARARLGLASLGEWVQAAPLDGRDLLSDAALLSLARLLREEGRDEKGALSAVSARGLLEPLAAYRNRVHGHGAVRDAAFYESAGARLSAGLAAAWEAGVFWPAGTPLLFVDSIEIDAQGRRRARVLDLTGTSPLVLDPRGTTDLPEDALPKRLFARGEAGWAPLHPWILFEESGLRERVLFFNGRKRSAEVLDFAGGESLRGKALEALFPGIDAEYDVLFARAAHGSGGSGGSGGSDGHASFAGTSEAGRSEAADPSRFGDYRLLGKLGEGGMGVVHLARQEGLGRQVALKMLPPHAARNEVARRRFEREIAALSRCDHPNVVKILASGEERHTPYYAMELIEGKDLATLAPELRATEGDIPARVRRLAGLFRDAALGASHLHEAGIIHRDLKPSNLMITDEGGRLVVMDLGLAALEDASSSLTRDAHGLLGTLRYMAPEQLSRGLLEIDRRADVYALGATFYELFTGRPLHDGETEARLLEQLVHEDPSRPERVNPRLPADLALILGACTERDRGRRYASASALAQDLDAFLEGRPVSARPPTLGYLVGLFVRRHRAACAATAAVLMVAIATIALYVAGLEEARRREEALRQAAQASERRAVESRAAAEDLLRFMLGDLQERLEPLGKLALLEPVAEKARAYYEGVDPASLVPEERLRYARSLAWIGAILTARGRDEASRTPLVRAEEIAAALLGDPRFGREARLVACVAARKLAMHAGQYRRVEPAREAARRARALVEPLRAEAAADPGVLAELVDVLYVSGMAATLADEPEEAFAFHAEARRLVEEALARGGERRMLEERLCISLYGEAHALWFLGRAAEALALEERDIVIAERILAEHPDNAGARRNLALSLRFLATCLDQVGRFDEVEAAARRGLTILEALSAADPDDLEVAIATAQALTTVGLAELRRNEVPASVASLERALATAEEVSRRSEDEMYASVALSLARRGLAKAYSSARRLPEADAMLERATPALASAAARVRASSLGCENWCGALSEHAQVLMRLRAPERAVEKARLAVDAALAGEARFPESLGLARRRAQAADFLAGIYEQMGRWSEAAVAEEDAIGARERLLAAEPTSPTRTSDLARVRSRAGVYRMNAKEPARAVEHYAAAEALWAKLETDPAGKDDPRLEGAECALTRGTALYGLGRMEEAEVAFRAAIGPFATAVERTPDDAKALEKLARARRGRVKALEKLGRSADLRAESRSVFELTERLLTLSPSSPDAHRLASLTHLDMANQAEEDGALEEAERRFASCLDECARAEALRPPSPKEKELRATAETRLAAVRARRAERSAGPAAPTGAASPRP